MKYDAFISYRRDSGFLMAQIIHDKLLEKGVTSFLDLEELGSGKFDEKILAAIQSSGVFILILPKNALNRCKNEDDWVRREILAAYHYQKRIIPVMYDGFKWPKQWHPDIPQEIKDLETMNGVSSSQEYFTAMIEKIISFMPEEAIKKSAQQTEDHALLVPTSAFFHTVLEKNAGDISGVDMCFYAGAEWWQMAQKVELLSIILKERIPIRVLANDSKSLQNMTGYMGHPLKVYLPYEDCLKNWQALSAKSQGLISLRVSKVPLLHRIYLIRCENIGAVNIKYYTYGEHTTQNDVRICYSAGTPEYDLYQAEFEYLWKQAVPYVE